MERIFLGIFSSSCGKHGHTEDFFLLCVNTPYDVILIKAKRHNDTAKTTKEKKEQLKYVLLAVLPCRLLEKTNDIYYCLGCICRALVSLSLK